MTRSQLRWYPLLIIWGLSLTFIGACTDAESSSSPQKISATTENEHVMGADLLRSAVTGKHEQESCTPSMTNGEFSRSDCEEGLICTPDVHERGKGFCRVPCGFKTEESSIAKDQKACPAGRSCQIITSLQLHKQGAFCLPKQRERDGLCQAMLDAEACTNNRSCLPNYISKNPADISPMSFVCRNTCPFGKPEAAAACLQNETCVPAKDRKTGICVQEITWASRKDFTPKFTGQTCNETNGHRFCNNSILLGLDKPADVTCFNPEPTKSSIGLCIALCSVPALDMDGDGKISPAEDKITLTCPVHYNCSGELARELGLFKTLPDRAKRQRKKSCDLTICPAGKPCPSLCGPGDSECIPLNSADVGQMGVCGAPFGSCEPNES
jgi:hypothetical protein